MKGCTVEGWQPTLVAFIWYLKPIKRGVAFLGTVTFEIFFKIGEVQISNWIG